MKILSKSLALVLILPAGCGESRPGAAPLADVLQRLHVEAAPGDLAPAPISGFLEVVRGMQVLYVSRDGSILINGEILSLAEEVNFTERRRSSIRLGLLDRIPSGQRIVAPAAESPRATIVVFVDTDCPYCLKLHEQSAEFARHGIEVQYLFYPRSGPSGESWSQAVSVWCAADRLTALGAALRGTPLPLAECAHPIGAHYELARELALKGTPAILGDDGAIRYGVQSPEEILDLSGR